MSDCAYCGGEELTAVGTFNHRPGCVGLASFGTKIQEVVGTFRSTPPAPGAPLKERDKELRPTWWQRLGAVIEWMRGGRPVCWRCLLPFSGWFVWDGWSYCYPCHAKDRAVIFEPECDREAFYD